jgi:PAS domain S-box-containing protein
MVAIAAVYDLFALRLMRGPVPQRMLAGLLFGAAAVLSMLNPVQFAEGVIYDARTVILSTGGFIGGPVTALIAALPAASYRLWLGGTGALVGTMTILAAAGLGILFHLLRRRNPGWERVPRLLLMGLTVHLAQLLLQLLLPGDLMRAALSSLLPVFLVVFPLMTALVAALFLQGERKNRAERRLRESEERYRSLFDRSSAPMLLLDPEENTVAEANPAAERFYGWDSSAMRGMRYERLSADGDSDSPELLREAQKAEMFYFELRHRRADESIRNIAASSGTLRLNGKEFVHLVVHDITPQHESERQLHDLLEEKAVLLREVHHRVKNNLAVMVSLLNLQAEEAKSPEAAWDALHKTRDRIIAMGSIHNLLYRSADVARLSFSDYLREMVEELRSLHSEYGDTEVDFRLEELPLDVNRAVPLGLIANEAVTNAFKHAFDDHTTGLIRLELTSPEEGWYAMRVRDNGCGFDAEPSADGSRSLGMQLIHSLCRQVEGELRVHSDGGTVVEVLFPVQEDLKVSP